MQKHLSYLLTLALSLSCYLSLSAQPWSLEQCIGYAWDNNINIQQQLLTAEQYDNNLLQSKVALAPSLGARASHSLSWGYSKVQRKQPDGSTIEVQESTFAQNTSPSIYASLDLFQGLRKLNNIKKTRSDYQAAEQDVLRLKNEVSLNVARAYLQVLLSMEVLKVAESSCRSLENQLSRIKVLVEAGSRPMSEQLELEAQLAGEQVQRVTAQNQVDVNYLTLRQLLDVHPSSDFSVVVPVLDIDNAAYTGNDINSLYQVAQNLPQIKSAEYRMESAAHSLSVAKGFYWPTLSMSGSLGSFFSDVQRDSFWEQLRDHRNPTLGFSLTIPLFNNLSYITNAKNAKLNLRIAQLEVENSRKTLYKEIQSAALDAAASYNRYLASGRNVKASQESFRYVEQKFDTGLLNATDYNVSKTNLLKAQSEELQAKYQYIFQLKIIDFYKGVPLTL